MKKENVFGLLMYLLILAFAVVYGLTVLQTHFQHSSLTQVWQYVVFVIICIVLGILISAILFELGHYVGAKVGGYKIVKFTILYFTIYVENNKRRFGFRRFDGLTGETLIIPNYQKKEKPNPIPYLVYGPIFNLAWFIGTIICFYFLNQGSLFDGDIAYAFLTIGLISLILFIYDIVPIKSDTSTNGYLLSVLAKNKDIHSFNELLSAKNQSDENKSPSDNTIKIETVPEAKTNTIESKVVKVATLIDVGEYEEANKLIEELLSKPELLTNKYYLEIQEQQIYIKILNTPYDEMAKFYDENIPLSLKRDISADRSLCGIRTYILMAGLFDKSRSECALALSKVAKAYKNTLPSRKHPELILFNDALERVCQAHPKWELDIYKLFE